MTTWFVITPLHTGLYLTIVYVNQKSPPLKRIGSTLKPHYLQQTQTKHIIEPWMDSFTVYSSCFVVKHVVLGG